MKAKDLDESTTREELVGLAEARLDGLHGALDSPADAAPACAVCRWCHHQSSPGGALLNIPQQRHR